MVESGYHTSNGAANKGRVGNELGELANNLVSTLRVDVFVVVAGEEGTAVLGPEILLDLLNGGGDIGVLDTEGGDNVQPGNNSPETVLLADVVGSGTKTLLTTDGKLLGVEQGAEELPAGGNLVAVEALGLGNKVNSTAGWHGAGKAIDTVSLEVRDELGVVGNDGKRVARRNESIGAVNHVTVTITVGGGTEGDAVLVDNLDERVGVGEVGVGVAAVEVRAGDAVLNSTSEAKLILEDGLAVRASDTVKAIEKDLELGVRLKELLDGGEVEDVLEHGGVVSGAVDNLNLERAIGLGANSLQVDIRDSGNLVGSQGLGGFEDLVGNRLGSRATVGQVVLDAEIVLRACFQVNHVFNA